MDVFIIGDSRTNMRKDTVSMIETKFKFVVPYSAADDASGADAGAADAGMSGSQSLEDLLNQMDSQGANTGGQTEGAAGAANSAQQNQGAGQTQQQQGSGQQNQDDQAAQQRSQQDKQNYAFGQMRTQINELTSLLGRIANANGIEYKDSKELLSKLTDDTISKMAQKQNVPVELLREIETLRQDSQLFKQQQLRNAAAIGFQNLQDQYKLTQQQLEQFAVELDQKGKNPFSQPVDLVQEYKTLHFDEILQNEIKKAVENALKQSSAADQNSSTPGKQQGGGSGVGDKITTVAGLSALLDGVK
jgi:hypothetical protein